ncbi:extracellular solute-binding protein [Streptomyces thinghirensis]|nr:extracellular solute-binding protein [Streptomyces thinghirensis]
MTPGGRTWGVPFDVTPQLLYYRTDLFERAGVEAPRNLGRVREGGGEDQGRDKGTRIPNAPKGGDIPFINGLAWQAGSQGFGVEGDAWTVDIDDKPAQKVAGFWDGLVRHGPVRNHPAWSEEESTAKKKNQVAAFIGAPWSGAGLISQTPEQKGQCRGAAAHLGRHTGDRNLGAPPSYPRAANTRKPRRSSSEWSHHRSGGHEGPASPTPRHRAASCPPTPACRRWRRPSSPQPPTATSPTTSTRSPPTRWTPSSPVDLGPGAGLGERGVREAPWPRAAGRPASRRPKQAALKALDDRGLKTAGWSPRPTAAEQRRLSRAWRPPNTAGPRPRPVRPPHRPDPTLFRPAVPGAPVRRTP